MEFDCIELEKYEKLAQDIRIDIVEMTYRLKGTGAHIGGALSLAEIMAVLYGGAANINLSNVMDEERDRIIFSKGHGTMALYSAMKYAKLLSENDLLTYKQNETILYAHPSMLLEKGIEFSSGSLGQGLSLGVGTCLALKRKYNNISKVYVILGDGECNEGSIWEAAESAAHFKCENLIAIIDRNHLQYDGNTKEIMNDDCLDEKWKSFGWRVKCVDGHDIEQLLQALKVDVQGPLAIIADTVKGKGISFMENNPLWHNHSLNENQYNEAMVELGGDAI